MLLLELQELAHQVIELGVASLWLVGDVVELFVMSDEATKFSDAGNRIHAMQNAKITMQSF
jgi:hypothetical protein